MYTVRNNMVSIDHINNNRFGIESSPEIRTNFENINEKENG